ncbi:sporulation and spore germination protein [Natranaerovirga pectinivora]|uniref:Sporulation and spore germination protein n=1 Tax=Natranaerovirga pectinivora TaxID=682400 RepID=A0A4R3MQD8_9FIRM|nr:Gmad2 immunoglobulin-like domain-containing protein [Natranaerovirga pectinivora]TCT16086.1 sporulation and spore germination protein [Natranaerovirga pectinivora]
MKKILTIIMIILVSLGILIGCNKKEIVTPDPSTGEKQEDTKEDETYDESNLSPKPVEEEKQTHEVVLYFTDNDLMETYRIKTEIVVGKDESVPKAALEAWINGPDHEELGALVHTNVIVEYVEDVNGVAHVSFSKEIQDSNLGSTGELMLVEQITMIMEQFGYNSTQILVEGIIGESLIGHFYTAEPILANDPDSYRWIDEKESREIVLQNVAFRIFEPIPGSEVKDQIVVRGLARVFEATIQYEFEDGHFLFDKGFTTASEGAPGWGEFEIIIDLDEIDFNSGSIILYEESAKDGSRLHELVIPVIQAK